MKTFAFTYIIVTMYAVIICALLLYFYKHRRNIKYKTATIKIANHIFVVKVADTIMKQYIGLSDHNNIDKYGGMLFIFHSKQRRWFWMNKMKFPIDIIWIDNNKVVDISKNVQPPSKNKKITKIRPIKKSNMVIEINSGLSEKLSVSIGDFVSINL